MTAVAFLVALFKARPSPFYVLDEVEAALDDVNLGRLIDIIEELRSTSQLIVITHQKRTMEIADALYGVSMRGDGVTQVIGQRLRESREPEPAAAAGRDRWHRHRPRRRRSPPRRPGTGRSFGQSCPPPTPKFASSHDPPQRLRNESWRHHPGQPPADSPRCSHRLCGDYRSKTTQFNPPGSVFPRL